MTTDIKAAIAGAIEALDAFIQQFDNTDRHAPRQKIAYEMAVKNVAALRRIEFVGGRAGHAIVKMGD